MEWVKVEFKELRGKIIESIDIHKLGREHANDRIVFKCVSGEIYKMYHDQDCCEDVYITDICGNIDDLINTPIVVAEMVTNKDYNNDDRMTWTFYKIATVKGWVDVRWCGTSNGYYSEEVDFCLLKNTNLN